MEPLAEQLNTEYVSIKELRSPEYNPRKWTEKARHDLTESLEKFGFVQPLVVNSAPERKGIVVGGSFKLAIAQEKGIEKLPVVWLNIPDIEKEKELNLRLNRNLGEWDFDLLAEFDQALLQDVGFDSKELDRIFDEDDEDDFNAEKEAAAIETPKAKIGDVYALGRHRLMCGDAGNIEHVKKLMGGGLADMVFTDPPYNVNYSGRGKNTSTTIENDHMPEQEFRKLLISWFTNYKEVMKKEAPLYTCYASRTHREFEDALNAAGFVVRNQIIWVKKVASMGWGDYRWKHEPILYCQRKESSPNYYGDRSQYTEWTQEMSDTELLKFVKKMVKREEQGGSTVWRLHREQKYDHPTQKPIKLVSIAIRNSSKRDDLVVDLFGGSGSTLIASEKLGRKCCIMEHDPRYVDVIIKRWEQNTGGKVENIETGSASSDGKGDSATK